MGGGRSKRTREHVFPAWLDDFLPGVGNNRTFHSTVESGEDGRVLRSWSSSTMDLVAKRVCASCNGGWMSRLETAAQPYLASMLSGHRRTYHEGGQSTLAGWAIKTALALDLANRDAYPPITTDHYRALAVSEGVPGDGVQVFMGAFRLRNRMNHQLRRLVLNGGEPDEASAFLATFHVGFVLFQVFFHDYPEPVTITRASGSLEWVPEIWPYSGPVAWPPKRITDDDALGQLKEGLSPMVERWTIKLP